MKTILSTAIICWFITCNSTAICQETGAGERKTIIDYFDKDFYRSNPFMVKNEKFLDVANYVAVNDAGSKLTIHENSIRISNFKSHSYLKFCFDSHNIFNSYRLDKNAIANKLMDELVNNLIEPEYGDLSSFKNIFGYEFMIFTGARDFTDDSSVSRSLIYHFFIPKQYLRQYKSLDITLKQLIHQSTVIVNNEKLDL